MATRRLMLFLAGAFAIGVGAAWVASDFDSVSPADRLCQVGVPYEVDVQEDQATFDLPFEAGGRYRIIVASVASQDVETSITLAGEKVPAVECFPLLRVPELQSAIPRHVHTSWKPPRVREEAEERSASTVPQDAPSAHSCKRTFYLHVTDGPLEDARQYAKVSAVPIADGRFVRVFLDSQMQPRQLAKGLVPEIVRLFDDEIVPGSRRVLGKFRDVDGDGKFAILISPWLGKLQGGQTSLGGFVRGSDFQKNSQAPFSNRADVLYLNANLLPGPHLKSLLAHEYAHAISFSERLPTKLHPAGLPGEEDWLNEAIAHLAENLHGTGWTNLDHRISRFLDATHNSPLVVRNYYAGGLWRDPGCRGATYLFLRWVVDQFGDEVLSRLIRGTEPGVRNLELATGVSFPDLFRGWTIALAQAGGVCDEEECSTGRFTSLDLNDRLGRWSLQGARGTEWSIEGEALTFSLCGTTAKIIDIHADTPGVYRLRVRTKGQPKLQVTLIRQADEPPPIQAIADWQTEASLSAQNTPGLRVRMESPGESGCRWVRVSLECVQGKHCQSFCWEADQLPAFTPLSGRVQELVLEPPGRLFPLDQGAPAKWQLKILTEDDYDRRKAGWIDLSSPPGLQSGLVSSGQAGSSAGVRPSASAAVSAPQP
jgi:hypothetical protein